MVQITAWCRSGDKALSGYWCFFLLTHICVAWPQCVTNSLNFAKHWYPISVNHSLFLIKYFMIYWEEHVYYTRKCSQNTYTGMCYKDADLSNPLKPVPHFNTKTVVPGTNIPIIKIRLSWISLIFVIGTHRRRFSGGIYMRQRTRSWLVQVKRIAWRNQAITWTSVELSSVRSSNIHLRAVSQEIPHQSINKISFKFAYLKFRSNILGANGLPMPTLALSSIPQMIHPRQFTLATV